MAAALLFGLALVGLHGRLRATAGQRRAVRRPSDCARRRQVRAASPGPALHSLQERGERGRKVARPLNELKNKIVAVTGASSGVGRAIAEAFGAQGARVALIARNQQALEHAADEIRSRGGQALVLPLDVADPEALQRAAADIVATWGHIDIWINNAMVTVFSPVKEMTPEEYRRVMEGNYLGTVYGTLAALRHMLSRDEGVIIQIGSALAYRSIPLQSAYCASKAAIRGFTDSLRSELLHDRSKIKLTELHLPAVNTPQFEVARNKVGVRPQPIPPIYQPEVIARAALHAALHPTREMWVAGSTFKAILGQKVIPGLLDRYLAKAGYSGQMTETILPEQRPDNLWEPVPGDHGAHGAFDSEARARSAEVWARPHRGALAASAAAAAISIAGALLGYRALRS
ncbi:MAG TPA: short-chain dehydrogenase [Myxococcales bacterium]|nr:short-chain dehydrogenase [Myxococcales bacterium]